MDDTLVGPGTTMTSYIEKDAGFCSGGDEDEGFCSHTDASDDSADVKIRAVSLLRNKRKCAEPRRVETEMPAKKRRIEFVGHQTTTPEPFRPWNGSPVKSHRTPSKLIPGWLADSKSEEIPRRAPVIVTPHLPINHCRLQQPTAEQEEPLSLVAKKRDFIGKSSQSTFKIDSILAAVKRDSVKSVISEQQRSSRSSHSNGQQQQRNYKNMTRERRIEANARERTRVHTISAAFDTLRHSIPAYSHNQKLSKLSVLRIACSYIKTLSRLAGEDLSADGSEPSLSWCVDNVSKTIQTEGKVRKKKEEPE